MLRYLLPVILFGCQTKTETVELPDFPEVKEAAPVMRRLTQRQYQLALESLFGDDLIAPPPPGGIRVLLSFTCPLCSHALTDVSTTVWLFIARSALISLALKSLPSHRSTRLAACRS